MTDRWPLEILPFVTEEQSPLLTNGFNKFHLLLRDFWCHLKLMVAFQASVYLDT